MDEIPNVKRCLGSFNFLSEFCGSCLTKAYEKHQETLTENLVALLNLFLKYDRNYH